MKGKVFGRLLVISRIDNRNEWLCFCNCGKYVNVKAVKLFSGDNRPCGCLLKERTKDLTSQRFGKLVAKSKIYNTKWRCNVWLCKCDCGNYREVPTQLLTSGEVLNCGCEKRKNPGSTINILGKTINNWKVLEKLENNKYLCSHTCGKNTIIFRGDIKQRKCKCEIKKTRVDNKMNVESKLINSFVGKRFGKLTVQKLIKFNYNKSMWACVCTCGTVIKVSSVVLEGPNPSCGCDKYRINPGDKFGRLTVLSRCSKRYYKNRGYKQSMLFYNCLCSCGKAKIAMVGNLLNSNTRSCGCLQFEISYQSKFGTKSKLDAIRRKTAYKKWRVLVIKRDNNTCQICNKVPLLPHAHHLKAFDRYPETRYITENGITICRACHKEFHTKYTSTKFTVQNFVDFLKTKKLKYKNFDSSK